MVPRERLRLFGYDVEVVADGEGDCVEAAGGTMRRRRRGGCSRRDPILEVLQEKHDNLVKTYKRSVRM